MYNCKHYYSGGIFLVCEYYMLLSDFQPMLVDNDDVRFFSRRFLHLLKIMHLYALNVQVVCFEIELIAALAFTTRKQYFVC